MADSNAFNFGGVRNPTEEIEQDVVYHETVGQFDIDYYESSHGYTQTTASSFDEDGYFQHAGFTWPDRGINSHIIQTGNYTQNDNFMGSLEHQFGIDEDSGELASTYGAPGQSENERIETYQSIVDQEHQAYVSNTMNIETEHNSISLHFDKIDYIDPTGTTDLGGAMTKDIEIIHYDDGVL